MERIKYCIICGSEAGYKAGRIFPKKTTCPVCHARLYVTRSLFGDKWRIKGIPAEDTAEIAERVIEARE